MPLLDLQKLTAGLSRTWAGFLRDWDRSLRSANHPETTRYNYLLAAVQLSRYLGEYSPDPDAEPGSSGEAMRWRISIAASSASWQPSGRRAACTSCQLTRWSCLNFSASCAPVCRRAAASTRRS